MTFLILLLGRIGDIILLTPFIKVLNEKYPNAKIDVIASTHNWVILKDNPRISQLYIYDKNPFKIIKLIAKLRLRKYSYYIDPKDHKSTESQIFAHIVRAENKIYFTKKIKNHHIYQIKEVDKYSGLHFSQKLMQPLQFLNIDNPQKTILPELWEDKDSQFYITNFFKNLPQGKINILLNISASKPNKMWDVNKWIDFLKSIEMSKFNIILSSDPKDRNQIEMIHNIINETIITPGRNFSDLISIITNSDIVITPDTSIVHIASAFNKPILALYSGLTWSHKIFGPLSEIQQLVFAPNEIDDIRIIKIEDLQNAFNALLNAYKNGQYYSKE
jgi:ADP-heptose:LPS heptosyltransferase